MFLLLFNPQGDALGTPVRPLRGGMSVSGSPLTIEVTSEDRALPHAGHRSTNRLPPGLSVPPPIRRRITANRGARSDALSVGSTGTTRNERIPGPWRRSDLTRNSEDWIRSVPGRPLGSSKRWRPRDSRSDRPVR